MRVYGLEQGRRSFLRAHALIVHTFRKKNLSRAHGKFEEQNKILEPSMLIIIRCILITNKYYNYIL